MNDFLKNLRSGKDKQQGHRGRYDKHNYRYESQKQHYGNEKRGGADRRAGRHHSSPVEESLVAFLKTITPVLTEFLSNASINQQRILEVEEKKVEALKSVMEIIRDKGMSGLMGSSDKARKRSKAKKPIDQNRKNILQFIGKMRNKGETFDQIAVLLSQEDFETFSGRGQWHAQTVHRLYQDYLADEENE